ncbi:MAG: primosomal protein N' [Oscillospiraceae bacterium]|nr:primosomal protein N' [Oscillospiraceae bacterium]
MPDREASPDREISEISVAAVAVAAAKFSIDKPYSYRVPDSLRAAAVPGARVAVPFGRGNKTSEGVVLAVETREPERGLKPIDAVLDAREDGSAAPLLGAEQLKLALWMSDRFFCTAFEALRAMLPAGVWYRDGKSPNRDKLIKTVSLAIPVEEARELAEKKRARAPAQAAVLALLASEGELSRQEIMYKAGVAVGVFAPLAKLGAVKYGERELFRRPAVDVTQAGELELTRAQTEAYGKLLAELEKPEASAALLYGVTGSGKTAVYIKLIEASVVRGKTAIVLVPEISLTPQLMSIFVSHFGDDVAVLHSSLGSGERYDEWKRIKSGVVKVVIGTRSAVFAPLEDIGLIVIDEEQEHTYKSEQSPRYHAREIAKYRCARSGALLLLGSATPSVESMFRAKSGAYTLVRLTGRFNAKPLPDVLIADMKEELKAGNAGAVGRVLENELRENISHGEQSILFLNRRGASHIVSCGECGYTFSCPNCDVSLTHHTANGRLMCHYCGYSREEAGLCPECGGRLKFVGAGTQKVEEELLAKFPEARIIRMDADTVSASNPHTKLLGEFRARRGAILLGTQMVAKGLDFEGVTLVGAVFADLSLFVNDYRAHERTFSLVTQVIGRAGRGELAGRAVIQTMTPGHEVIRLASRQDYDDFYEREIARREASGAPPARDLLVITASGAEEAAVLAGCVKIRDSLRGYLAGESGISGAVSVLGPAPAAVMRVNNRYRYRITLMCRAEKRVREIVAHTVREFLRDGKNRGVSVHADIDPFD